MVNRSTLGWVWLVKGAFDLGTIGLFSLFFGGIGGIAMLAGDQDGVLIGGSFVVFSILFFLFVLLLTAPSFLAAYGLIRNTSWGDLAALIVAVLQVGQFPVGTILSLVTFMTVAKKT